MNTDKPTHGGYPESAPQLAIAEDSFIQSFNALAQDCYQTAVKSGWWDDRRKLVEIATAHSPELGEFAKKALAGMSIALEHSELSEALEGLRKDLMDDKIPEFTAEEAEKADTIIRIMDDAAAHGLRIAEAVVAKARMNKTREYKHGGKKF